jgi:cyclophilin family peptidyl-prolyl cis-trans isomerase
MPRLAPPRRPLTPTTGCSGTTTFAPRQAYRGVGQGLKQHRHAANEDVGCNPVETDKTSTRRRRGRGRRNAARSLVATTVVVTSTFSANMLWGDSRDDAAQREADIRREGECLREWDGCLAQEAELAASGCPTEANGKDAIVEFFDDERRKLIFTDIAFDDPIPVWEPPSCVDEGQPYVATLDTFQGSIQVELDVEAAPETANNFVFLARWNYYDNVGLFIDEERHIIESTDQIVPLGDPEAPGYEIEAERPTEGDASYAPYSVCMLGGTRSSTSHGGRFFIVLPDTDTSQWANQTTCFGRVTSGQDTVSSMMSFEDDQARWPHALRNVTVEEGSSRTDPGE